MATKPTKITAWSFSRHSTYQQCPLKLKLGAIDRIKEPGNQAMDRGNAIHKLAEQYIKGLLTRLPAELKLFEPTFKNLKALFKKRAQAMAVEDNWSFTKTWEPCAWDDWDNCWVRIKLDCAHMEGPDILVVTDWKTGKYDARRHEEYLEQLELYALAALILHTHVKEVRPRLAYLDLGTVYPESPLIYTHKDVDRLKKLWEKRVKAMMSDVKFAPRPNDKCKWCHYRAGNKADGGGQCKF